MYDIIIMATPVIEGFKANTQNGKISGANLTLTIAITDDDTIFRPVYPVRICAWLQTTPQDRPRVLSPSSGRKDDLLWTKTAADRGSLTIVFRITKGYLNEACLAETSLEGAQLKVRLDLPRHSRAKISPKLLLAGPLADDYSTESSCSVERSKTVTLQTLLTAASPQVPLDVVTIGTGLFDVALAHAGRRLRKIWRDFMAQDALPARFEPSTVAVADDAEGMIMVHGDEIKTGIWAERAIKYGYIVPMLQPEVPKPLAFAIILKFLHLDSGGLGDSACNRSWSIIMAADDPTLDETAREMKANQIEALTLSSIWHSTEKISPKLVLMSRGPLPTKELTLLDMLKSDGWEAVEKLDQLPEDLFAAAPADIDVSFLVLEYRARLRDYMEIVVSTFERKHPGKTIESMVDPNLWRVARGTADGINTARETMQAHLCGEQGKEHSALEVAVLDLQSKQSQMLLDPAATKPGGAQEQKQYDMREVPVVQPEPKPVAKRQSPPEELNGSVKKRLRGDSSLGETDQPILETGHDAAAAHGSTIGMLQFASSGGTSDGMVTSEAEGLDVDDAVNVFPLQERDVYSATR